MLDDVLVWLRCPNCEASLARNGGSLRCTAGHSFDIARHGYVSLMPPGVTGHRGDTAAMVRARREFLDKGHFAPISAALTAAAVSADASRGQKTAGHHWPCVADIGAGTGYYLAAVLARLTGYAGLALDVSKPALRTAARAHPAIGAVGCDAWRRLPVADGAAGLVLDVFAPRDGAELGRILRPDGHLLVITPLADHLAELTGPLRLLQVDDRKPERLAATLGPAFTPVGEQDIRAAMSLDHSSLEALAAMGPSAWHSEPEATADRIAALPEPVAVTLAVRLSVFRPRR